MDKVRILVADDEPGVRFLVGSCLRQEGYDVIEVSDGEEALQAAEDMDPSLIILDIFMPKMTGFEMCQRVRGWSKVPILMISASGGEENESKSRNLGADDFLGKPFRIDDLINRVQTLLQR
ncbi:MAG: response regulator transcription factor [Dehalococcoidia bacterium]